MPRLKSRTIDIKGLAELTVCKKATGRQKGRKGSHKSQGRKQYQGENG